MPCRVSAMLGTFAMLIASSFGAALVADEAPPKARPAAIAEARRTVEAATLRLRLYERVEHPRKLRRLEAEIKLAEAEIVRLRELLAEYRAIAHRTIPSPLLLTRQQTELSLLESQLRLEGLKEEHLAAVRYHGDQCRLFQLEIESAAAYLNELLGD